MKKMLILVILLSFLLSLPVMAEEQSSFNSMSNEELLSLQLSLKQELVARDLLESSLLFPGEYVAGVDIRPGVYRLFFVNSDRASGSVYVTHFKNVEQFKKARSGGFSSVVVWENDGVELYVKVGSPAQVVLTEGEVLRTNWGVCFIEPVDKPSWAP